MESLFERITEFDHNILIFIQKNLRFEAVTPVMIYSSWLVNAGIFWILLSLLLICFKRTRMIGIVTLSSITFCFLINNVLIKNLVGRTRPFDRYDDLVALIKHPTDSSFASGHTTCSFASAGILSRFLNKPLAAVTISYACLVAFSRLYLGVHYPSDVLVGFLIGLIGSMLVYKFFDKRYELDKYKMKKVRERAEENT